MATTTRTLAETIDDMETMLADAYDTTVRVVAERTDELTEQIERRLDQLEERLPELPRKIVGYNRAVANRAVAQSRRNNEMVVDAFRPVVKVADSGIRTVVGTTTWAVERTSATAASSARSVVGQARAQVNRTLGTANDQAVELVEEATERVQAAERSAERVALSSMTKAELYDMAQDLEIDGRAGMNKGELVAAINAAR